MTRALVMAAVLAGCTSDVDPAWQLDHDRIIAVRATPPRIASGETASIDAFVGNKGAPPVEAAPELATVDSPTSLGGTLARTSTGWAVTAPAEDRLAAARTDLGLAADDPVPLRLRVTAGSHDAFKIVWLGVHADNPVIDPISIDGMDAVAATQLSVAAGVSVPLAVDFDDTYRVEWLTSCGTMHDFDLPKAYLRVEPVDPHTGSLAIVVRDASGGVAWRVWPISAE